MTRRLVLINTICFACLALVSAAVWNRTKDEIMTHTLLHSPAENDRFTELTQLCSFSPVRASAYLGIAEQNLLSPDRNPTIILNALPSTPTPEPPLPQVFGVILLDELPPTILLSNSSDASKRAYHPGESFGKWQIVTFDRQRILLQYEGIDVIKRVTELMENTREKPRSQSREIRSGQIPPPVRQNEK